MSEFVSFNVLDKDYIEEKQNMLEDITDETKDEKKDDILKEEDIIPQV